LCRPELDSEYLLKDLFEDITIFSNRTLDATAEKRPDGKSDIKLDIETHKYKADDKGNETEVPLDDWIEIGAFAKPEKGKKYGKTLYRQRLHLTSTKPTQTFTVDELPDQACVDPFLLFIDRVPTSGSLIEGYGGCGLCYEVPSGNRYGGRLG